MAASSARKDKRARSQPLASRWPRSRWSSESAPTSPRGLEAVIDYAQRIDGIALAPGQIKVSPAELCQAHDDVDPAYLATIAQVRENILAYQKAILHHDVMLERKAGIELGLLHRPLRRVGVCIPGGAAAYPSSLLMTVVPAQAAGVSEIAVVVPPSPFGGFNKDVLAACHALGVTEVYRIGGASGVAALAYGVSALGLEPVDKIVGPGNLFVALAKRHVFGTVDIDGIAGPSEVVVIADGSAVPRFLAADLISQAEHSPGVSILVTWERSLLDEVARELDEQLGRLSRGTLARDSLERFGASFWPETRPRRSRSATGSRPSICTSRPPNRNRCCRVSPMPARSSSAISPRWPPATMRRARRTYCRPAGPPAGGRGSRPTTS